MRVPDRPRQAVDSPEEWEHLKNNMVDGEFSEGEEPQERKP